MKVSHYVGTNSKRHYVLFPVQRWPRKHLSYAAEKSQLGWTLWKTMLAMLRTGRVYAIIIFIFVH